MNNLKLLSAYTLVLMSVSASISAQDTPNSNSENEKIILYNSQPVKVELAGDKIKSFIGPAPANYMEGYELVNTKNVVPLPSPKQNVVVSETVVNGSYAIVTNEKVMLNFKPGFATLDRAMINKLNEVVVYLKSNSNLSVLLTSHFVDDNSTMSKLSDNRLGAATAYLKIKGISLNRIRIETQKSSGITNVIAVNYLK
jgi:outer membrane protein OmpA-like peptidoglycan-associated protein